MHLCKVLVLALVGIHVSATTSNSASKHSSSEWYECSENTFQDVNSTGIYTECAVISQPLCYPGVCETPDTVQSTIDVFVKRMPATKGRHEAAPNIWFLQGGPGLSSVALETLMSAFHHILQGSINLYTMDHRGTGRSTLLDCNVSTTGSGLNKLIKPSAIPTCASELQSKFGDLAAFSVTSAAMDLKTLMTKYTNGARTLVFTGSYGSVLIERFMHFAPTMVSGYVIDGIATASGASAEEFLYLSNWDRYFGEIGEKFLALSEKDHSLKSHFGSSSLSDTLNNLLEQFDKMPDSPCAKLISKVAAPRGGDPPAVALRVALGTLLMDQYLRRLIPPVVYRLNRCKPDDIKVLTHFVKALNRLSDPIPEDAYSSSLLYYLIVYSEMWENPTPDQAEMTARFMNYRITNGDAHRVNAQYCAFSKEKSDSCDEIGVGNYDANGIIYERDQYWNKSATISDNVSVLLLSGGLDPQTPPNVAESFFRSLDAANKELITFKYIPHGTLGFSHIVDGDLEGGICGFELFESFIVNNGNLKLMNKTCVDRMPAFSLTVPPHVYSFMSTENAYDGIYNSSLSSE